MPLFIRSVVALLAVFAVLIGSLEHEDLILQEPAPHAVGLADDRSATDAFSTEDNDSGTEGTFRFHLPRLWLCPPAAAWKPLRIAVNRAAPFARVMQDRRLALAGRVALRL